MSLRDCIGRLARSGDLKPDEAKAVLDRYEERVKLLEAEGFSNARARAKRDLQSELREAASKARRVKLLALQARDNAMQHLNDYRTPLTDKPDVGRAASLLYENDGTSGSPAVRTRFEAIRSAVYGEMSDFVAEFRRNFLFAARQNSIDAKEIVRAGFKENVNPQAQALYQSWIKGAEKLRQMFVQAGGDVGYLADWRLPQMHNGAAVLFAKFPKWSAMIDRALDWEGMRHPDGAAILPAERNDVLKWVYDNIVTDGLAHEKPLPTGGRSALWRSRADPRFLKFKDADGWLKYNEAFGAGNVLDALTGHLDSLARDVAHMQVMGPNPAAFRDWLKGVIEHEAAKTKLGKPSLFPDTADPRGIDTRVAGWHSVIDSYHEEARGGNSVNKNRFALWAEAIRNIFIAAPKLGSAVLSHITQNPTTVAAMGRLMGGTPIRGMIGSMLSTMGKASERELVTTGFKVDDFTRSFSAGAREAGWLARFAKWSVALPDATTRLTFMNKVMNATQRSAWSDTLTKIGSYIDDGVAWQALDVRTREKMQAVGMDARDWATMQMAERYKPDQRAATWLRFEDVRNVGMGPRADELIPLYGLEKASPAHATIAVAKAAEETSLKYLEYLHQESMRIVPTHSWSARYAWGASRFPAGTVTGEIVRSVGMFKGYITTFYARTITSWAQELSRSMTVGAGIITAEMLGLWAGGMLTQQLKAMSAGKDPLPMDPTTGAGAKAWISAFLTSGSMGYLGDFLHSETSSFGHSLAESMAGPTIELLSDFIHAGVTVGSKFVNGKSGREIQSEVANDLLRIVRNNTPVVSTAWYLRAAYNRIILDQLQATLDPKGHQRMREAESKQFHDTGQRDWWQRGQVLPSRAPELTRGR